MQLTCTMQRKHLLGHQHGDYHNLPLSTNAKGVMLRHDTWQQGLEAGCLPHLQPRPTALSNRQLIVQCPLGSPVSDNLIMIMISGLLSTFKVLCSQLAAHASTI